MTKTPPLWYTGRVRLTAHEEMKEAKKVNITIGEGKDAVKVEAEPKVFKSQTSGFYFRGRVKIGKDEMHVQVIISK